MNDRRDIPAKIMNGGVYLKDEDPSLDLYVPEATLASQPYLGSGLCC